MDREFELNGKNFKLNKINAFKQFHIVRRISPILAELLPVLEDFNKKQKATGGAVENQSFEEVAKIASPIMLGLSKLSDEDSDKVLYGLLASVEMQQGSGGWAKVAVDGNPPMLMMQDMELPILMQVAGRAFFYNLSGFFNVAPRT